MLLVLDVLDGAGGGWCWWCWCWTMVVLAVVVGGGRQGMLRHAHITCAPAEGTHSLRPQACRVVKHKTSHAATSVSRLWSPITCS